MEPITAAVTAIISQIKLWSGILGKWKSERKEKLAGMALADVELIDSYVQQGRFAELMKAWRDKSGWPQTEAREYLNLVIEQYMAIEPQAVLTAEPMSWETFAQKLSYGLRGATEYTNFVKTPQIPDVGSGEVKEAVKKEVVITGAKQLITSPLNLIQKYWYVIPIILIPLVLYIRKKGNPCKRK